MKTETSRYDFVPYPWPVKPALLFLLGLPEDASQKEYEARWNEAVAPAKDGEWAKILFMKEVENQQRQGKNYDDAWNVAVHGAGKRLFAAYQKESAQRKQAR